MITAALHNKSANKNKYKILYPLEAMKKTIILKNKIILSEIEMKIPFLLQRV